jgi:hypothetical protein
VWAAAYTALARARACYCTACFGVCMARTACHKHAHTARCDRPLLTMPCFTLRISAGRRLFLQALTTCRRQHRRSRWRTTTFWLLSTMRCWRCTAIKLHCASAHLQMLRVSAHVCHRRRPLNSVYFACVSYCYSAMRTRHSLRRENHGAPAKSVGSCIDMATCWQHDVMVASQCC